MTAFLGLTPTVRVVLENPLLRRIFPPDGSVVVVVDTGYEGFLAVPDAIFDALDLNQLRVQTRALVLADGTSLTTRGAYGTLTIPTVPVRLDGFIETYQGLEEALMGTDALARLSLSLDYCTGRMTLQDCP